MDRSRLQQILEQITRARLAVLGDFCLDAYWFFDPSGSEISLETGQPTQAVRQQRYGLGGAGNVVNNLIDLGVRRVWALGVVGDDLFGREMVGMLAARGAETAGMVVQSEGWDTPVYGKPYEGQQELRRIDFGVFNRITAQSEQELIERLRRILPELDAVIINQQLARGVHSDSMIERLNRLAAEKPGSLLIVDSRDRAEKYRHVILKLNDLEAARICGRAKQPGEPVVADEAEAFARQLFQRTGRPVFITRSRRGNLVFDGRELHIEPGIQLLGRTDPVGAGDTAVAAIGAALAAGATPAEAATLANFAATVTVQKLQQTGTASPDEIIEIGTDPDYVYRPELADDIRRARYLGHSQIELVTDRLEPGRISHVVFDHDGTISTLRQGWEAVMEPMMVRAILGDAYLSADEALYQRVVARVRDYIDRSTGLQTIVQMQALVEMVREFGCVPEEKILDRFGYKAIYNQALMDMVRDRLAKLTRGELDVHDLTIKGALRMLHRLRDRGVKLYLASGTDRQDVIAEAKALGYAELFEGRIYGAVGDVSRYSKKMVIQQILTQHRLCGGELACFGDGPVELRETRKRGGLAIGVASDEVRRYGLNNRKRARLVRAGADLIIPDFSQADRLLDLLWPESTRPRPDPPGR
ncbi:MAG: PfkB family carbohydrate kinase [Phycisphaerae bacterium]